MRTLGGHAVRLGMHTGALVATNDGRNLYRALGVPSPPHTCPKPEPLSLDRASAHRPEEDVAG